MADHHAAGAHTSHARSGPLRQLAGFELLERIGQGGMGTVFKARQVSLDRIVALKVLPPSLAKQSTFAERFIREARASARLSHPNIVGGIDVGQDGGVYYFAMEYVEGQSARQLLKQGPLPEKRVLEIGRAIAAALAHAHAHGIVHRDVKPDNILIDTRGTPKLCDLGLARLETQSEAEKALTQDGTALGTPHYISPEQAAGRRDLDAKSDLYSLGATLYHMLLGKPMFEGSTSVAIMAKHITEQCPSPEALGVRASKDLVAILGKLLTKDRADRYESADQLAADLARVASGQAPLNAALAPAKSPFLGTAAPAKGAATGTAPLSDAVRTPHHSLAPTSSPTWLLPAAIGALIVVVGLAYVFTRKPASPITDAIADAPIVVAPLPRPVGPPPVPAASAVSPEELKSLWSGAEDFAQKNPEDYAAALAGFEKVLVTARGTEYARKAQAAIEALNKRRDEYLAITAQRLSDQANALARQGKYDAAVGIWQALPGPAGTLLRPLALQAVRELQAQAEARVKALLAEAQKCFAEKRWADGKKVLDPAAIEYRAANARLQDHRTKLIAAEEADAQAAHQTAVAAAETAFTRYVNPFAAATLKGDLKSARKLADEAKADAALKVIAAKNQELSDLCDALDKAEAAKLAALKKLEGTEHTFETSKGTIKGMVLRTTPDEIFVEFQQGAATGARPVRFADLKEADRKRLAGDFKPQTSAEHLAQATRALVADDAALAAAELTAAKDCSLAPLYQARLDEKLLGVAEGAAKSAWEALLRAAPPGKIAEQKAKELSEKLDAFEKLHGQTKLAASLVAELAALKDRLLTAGAGWKMLTAEELSGRVVLKGQASAAVENGMLVVTIPPGHANSATLNLLTFARDYRLRLEYNFDLLELALRKLNWCGFIHCQVRPHFFLVRTCPSEDGKQVQKVAGESRMNLLQPGWHKADIALIGRSFTLTVDGNTLYQEENLPAVARGDTLLWLWSSPNVARYEFRNVCIAQLDKDATEGSFEGMILAHEYNNQPQWLEFRTDGEDASRRFLLPKPVLDYLLKNQVVFFNRGKLSWKLQPDGRPALLDFEVQKPARTSGTLVGVVTFNQNNIIELRPERGPAERFVPVHQANAFDPNTVQALGKVNQGDKIKLSWVYDNRKRVTAIEPAP